MTAVEEACLEQIFLNYKWAVTETQNPAEGRLQHRQNCAEDMVRNGCIHKSARMATELVDLGYKVAGEFCDLLEKAEAAALEATEKLKSGDPDWAPICFGCWPEDNGISDLAAFGLVQANLLP